MTWYRDDVTKGSVVEYMEHLNGVPWHEAPIPRRWHRCKPQTRGTYQSQIRMTSHFVERCACGAFRMDSWQWAERNQRRAKRDKSAQPLMSELT